MNWFDLDRQYFEWRSGEFTDLPLLRMSKSRLGWADLLLRRRVVLLAEGGSGKSREVRARAQLLQQAGKFAAVATILDVDKAGSLEGALRSAERASLDAWRSSEDDGWFFLDSIDEAKRGAVRFQRVAGLVADAIKGHEGRAHVMFTGRPADWETRADLESLLSELPIPPPPSTVPAPDPNELLVNIIRRRRAEPPAPQEQHLVVVMAPLDTPRIEKYATSHGVQDPAGLMQAISDRDLASLAGRPLDLHWIADFWKSHRRLGTLREMLHRSLTERLTERRPGAAAGDALTEAAGLEGLERIGAALVFAHKRGLQIPDSDDAGELLADSADLVAILPDWTGDNRSALLRRAVFEPGPLGTVQLHSDNNGDVRAYLTSRWLHRLRTQSNLSLSHLLDLLFATTYGVRFVRPALKGAAAWLAVLDDAVASEMIAHAPNLLLTMGDPESLSVPVRKRALEAVCNSIAAAPDLHSGQLDEDGLKRFISTELIPTLRTLWSQHAGCAEVRTLLTRLIWLGKLKVCVDLAESVLSDRNEVPIVQRSWAARVIGHLGDDQQRRALANTICDSPEQLHLSIVWELVVSLFPSILSLDEVIALIEKLDSTEDELASMFETGGVELVAKMQNAETLGRYLGAVLNILGGVSGGFGHEPDLREERYAPSITSGALRLLQVSAKDVAPSAAIDAVLRLGESNYSQSGNGAPITKELHRSSERRRAAFWQAANCFRGNPHLQGGVVTRDWEMRMLGYDPGIVEEDLDWLLSDVKQHADENNRRLALNTLLMLWRALDSSEGVMQKIESAVDGDATMMAELLEGRKPQKPNPEIIRMEQQSLASERRNAAQLAARDRHWIDFIASLKAKPEDLRSPRPTTENGVDSRLFHLWELLRGVHESKHRYSLDSLGALGDLLGPELSAAFVSGLGMHWRQWQPKLDSQKQPDQRNTASAHDLMGIAGLSLEAASDKDWAAKLSPEEAIRAAEYSTLEINGLPQWLAELSKRHPGAVCEVYCREIRAELSEASNVEQFGVLHDASRADVTLHWLIAPGLIGELAARDEIALPALKAILSILLSAANDDAVLRESLAEIALRRFHEHGHSETAAAYLSILFTLDPQASTQALADKLSTLANDAERGAFLIALLPRIVGSRWRSGNEGVALPFESLVQMVCIAYDTLNPKDDPNHSGVYSPSALDHAVDSRDLALTLLSETPGRATFEALRGLSERENFPLPAVVLHRMSLERAEKDSDQEAWPLSEVYEFERSRYFAPRTTRGLQDLAANRVRDIQHDLLHADFAQGQVVCDLPNEKAVQLWVADRFESVANRSYSVERESHVASEKEPDIRLRSRESDATLPIEIKIAESWSFSQLETALVTQLCGQYLRHDSARHGVLLLVHQDARSLGWKRPGSNEYLSFQQLVDELTKIAAKLASSDPLAVQPIVATLDVSHYKRSAPVVNPPE